VKRTAVARLLAGGAAIALGGAVLLTAGGLTRPSESQGETPARATAKVERRTLNATTQVSGTLGYAETYAIANALATTADPASALQSYVSALSSYNAAVNALEALRDPKATDVASAQAQLAQAQAAVAAQLSQMRTELASAEEALAKARKSLAEAKTTTATEVAATLRALDKAKTTYSSARTSFASLADAVHVDVQAFTAAIQTARSELAAVSASLAGVYFDQLNTLATADLALSNARTNAGGSLTEAVTAYAAAAARITEIADQFDAAVARSADTAAIASRYQLAQAEITLAAARLSSAIDTPTTQISSAQTSVTTVQTWANSYFALQDDTRATARQSLATLQSTLTTEVQLASAIKSKISQATAQQSAISDAVNGSYLSAQASYAAGQAKAQTSVQNAQDAVTSAEQALTTARQKAEPALGSSETAQQSAQLDAARAGLRVAETALHALLHPSARQLKQANDALSTASLQLAASKEKLEQPRGLVTQLAEVGSVVQPGEVLFTLDGTNPAVLMTGAVPAWRRLEEGVSDGADVQQLESNLQALGLGSATLKVDQHWDTETTSAVKRWQSTLGLAETGVIPLGRIVFEPGAMRITARSAVLGATIQPGAAVLQATSTTRVVTVALQPSLQSKVKKGDLVSVILPDGKSAAGKVSHVSSVAAKPASSADNAVPTITVLATLDDPSATGSLDQAPVTVNITTATAKDVLAVPVTALVQLLDGGYAVQIKDGDQLRYVPVKLGLFAGGWVQVAGEGLAEGRTVVVAR
jgi:peptidoglycan hydrolase-like protein with peptidoglycan-binding domain/predicted  nucleic acid-binding Zn-ribbon protein